MAHYLRCFFSIVALFLPLSGYAVDHIICHLSESGIPAAAQANESYANTYTCTNTYPASFPGIQLTGIVQGNASGASVTGSCAATKLTSGNSCQFVLTVTPQTGTQTFYLQISVGSLYYINLPSVTTTVNNQPPPAVISIDWPGYNSGFAQADSTENGFGGFLANATDSSGHPITYLFEIIAGPGTITGSQTGSFSLTGVDGSTIIRITATADDAAPVVGTPFAVAVSSVPLKALAFFNNTAETIYPVIEAPILNVDPWMQAQFGITQTDIDTFSFQATQLHRVYVNGINGIAPGQTALVSVPFYSYLVSNPSGGDTPDQYVDWWSSMRVYLYDVQANLIKTQSEAGVAPVTLYTPGPTCISGCTQTTVFSAPVILPTNDPQQLTEYTFADVITASPPPYPINRTIVNYDYSAVDQVYLPVAMEPYGSNLVGYTGTVVDLPSFRSSLNDFVTETKWPVYAGLPYLRVPGAYNVVIGNPELTDTAPQTADLQAYWINCNTDTLDPDYNNCTAVYSMFSDNSAACPGGAPLNDPSEVTMDKLYGYVGFCDSVAPLPSNGPGFEAYTALQYNYQTHTGGYNNYFNPYTSLIHQALQMNVYAYSVDDAVAFIRAIGNGLVITVGGVNGLANPEQYNKQALITVSPGTPLNAPFFTHYGICSPTASSGQLGVGESFSFQLPSASFPCEITLSDSNNNLYHFTILSPAPLTTTATYISCASAWCSETVQVTSAQGISTGAPTPTT